MMNVSTIFFLSVLTLGLGTRLLGEDGAPARLSEVALTPKHREDFYTEGSAPSVPVSSLRLPRLLSTVSRLPGAVSMFLSCAKCRRRRPETVVDQQDAPVPMARCNGNHVVLNIIDPSQTFYIGDEDAPEQPWTPNSGAGWSFTLPSSPTSDKDRVPLLRTKKKFCGPSRVFFLRDGQNTSEEGGEEGSFSGAPSEHGEERHDTSEEGGEEGFSGQNTSEERGATLRTARQHCAPCCLTEHGEHQAASWANRLVLRHGIKAVLVCPVGRTEAVLRTAQLAFSQTMLSSSCTTKTEVEDIEAGRGAGDVDVFVREILNRPKEDTLAVVCPYAVIQKLFPAIHTGGCELVECVCDQAEQRLRVVGTHAPPNRPTEEEDDWPIEWTTSEEPGNTTNGPPGTGNGGGRDRRLGTEEDGARDWEQASGLGTEEDGTRESSPPNGFRGSAA